MTSARRSDRRVIRSYKRFIKLYDARYAALVKGNTRDQLTAALIELVAGEGMDRASVREVATAAGVAIGTVQYHFPTRRDLLTGAFEAVVHGVRDRLALPAARADADPGRNRRRDPARTGALGCATAAGDGGHGRLRRRRSMSRNWRRCRGTPARVEAILDTLSQLLARPRA
ncbi:hypothetical protein BN11_1830008 [Nostocoides australiense Ben110]|uniref:HTH tetR-type domain-containing protein n=1 Tax=Nostocoides australiense Ben110 TaxID=1193182 RepID=W6JVM4_9MICO|nr:hypothetical protein BN11_1830008 [Tetrasphaera australiensis Ben110]